VYVPYGKGSGMAFGMGAAEQVAFDTIEKYIYAISEQGAVNVVDFVNVSTPTVLPLLYIDLQGAKATDIEICASKGWVIVATSAADKVSNGKVHIFTTVKRTSLALPTKLKEIIVGPLPDMILPNGDCTKLAVANEGEGAIISGKLVDPEGSAMIVSGLDTASPQVNRVSFANLGSDTELIAKGVHLPLPLNALEYWDIHSDVASDLDFADVRSNYNAAVNLEPEYMAWSGDGTKLYVSLQENSAMVTVDVASATATRIDAYGLKSWAALGIDLVKDKACDLTVYSGLYSMRNPDSIAVVNVDNVDYILTANEGDDKEYGDYEEKWKAKDLISSSGTPKPKGMTITQQAKTAYLSQNSDGADSKRRLSVGSSAVDYTNSSAPQIHKTVMFGGRSLSIYKRLHSGLNLTWDSGSQLEEESCKNFNWAHNGVQDEEFSPVNGAMYNISSTKMKKTLDEMNDPNKDGCSNPLGACPLGQTIDERSPKDGPATEAITAGIACGRLIMVTAGEKNGIIYVYDISDISSPALLFVKHLSPASKDKNPSSAYADKTLGEIDPETIIFMDEQKSPSGNAGVLFAGAWSGTISWWEFQCPSSYVSPYNPTQTKTTTAAPQTTDVSMWGSVPTLWLHACIFAFAYQFA